MTNFERQFTSLVEQNPALATLTTPSSDVLSTPALPPRVLVNCEEVAIDRNSAEGLRDTLLAVGVTDFALLPRFKWDSPSIAKIEEEAAQLQRTLAQSPDGISKGSYLYFAGNGTVMAHESTGFMPLVLMEGYSIVGAIGDVVCGQYRVQTAEPIISAEGSVTTKGEVRWGGKLILNEATVHKGELGEVEDRYSAIEVPISPLSIGWAHIPNFEP